MHAVASDSRQLAIELHALLEDLDAARFRAANPAGRLEGIRIRLDQLLSHTWPDESLRALQDRLAELAAMIEDHAPEPMWGRREWARFRAQALPAYEALAASLGEYEIHVPSLRPTNVLRNVYHVLNAALIVLMVEVILDRTGVYAVATACLIASSSMEISRRLDPRINQLLMRLFGRVAHPHEAHRVNSATWYTVAIFALAWFYDHTAGVLGVAVLGLGDPMAALIGRRFGRVKLMHGRTLEGTLAFVAFGALAAWGITRIWHPELGIEVALVAGVFGAAAELLTRRIDDNLAVPLAAAFGAWLAM